jgi:hypothetical protein
MTRSHVMRGLALTMLLSLAGPRLPAQPRVESWRENGGPSRADANWKSRSRHVIGVVVGAVVGGTAGYLITKSACARCDDSAPMAFGAVVGAAAGGLVGGLLSRQEYDAGRPRRRWPTDDPLYFTRSSTILLNVPSSRYFRRFFPGQPVSAY